MKFIDTVIYVFEVKRGDGYVMPYAVAAGDLGNAMVAANKHYGSLPQGAWMENGPNSFYWALGNFFD